MALIGMAVAFFLLGGYFVTEKETKKIEPPPAIQLGENAVTPANLSGSVANLTKTLQASGQQPLIRSDEAGTKLNLQAYEYIQQKNYQQAEPILRRALQSFPDGTTAVAYKYSLYNLGHVLRRLGKAKEAVPYLEQCVKLDPQWSKAQTELAIARSEAANSGPTQISRNLH